MDRKAYIEKKIKEFEEQKTHIENGLGLIFDEQDYLFCCQVLEMYKEMLEKER